MAGVEVLVLALKVMDMALLLGGAAVNLSGRVREAARVVREAHETGKPIDDSVIDELIMLDEQLSDAIRKRGL